MKIRFDFVTNSSSSCYVIKLQITNIDKEVLEYEGRIDEESCGYLNDEGTCDPRELGEADSIESLKKMLNSLSTLSDNDWDIKDNKGEKLDWWSPQKIPGCPENDDEFDDWYEDILYTEGKEGYVFNGFLSELDEKIQSMDSVKSISVECDGVDSDSTFVREKYNYDLKSKEFSEDYEAKEFGEDVTEEMLNEYYTIDCGDDCLDFQLKNRIKK